MVGGGDGGGGGGGGGGGIVDGDGVGGGGCNGLRRADGRTDGGSEGQRETYSIAACSRYIVMAREEVYDQTMRSTRSLQNTRYQNSARNYA